jgi:hypothetical protein
MGMYTEFFLRVTLKEKMPEKVVKVLEHLLNKEEGDGNT